VGLKPQSGKVEDPTLVAKNATRMGHPPGHTGDEHKNDKQLFQGAVGPVEEARLTDRDAPPGRWPTQAFFWLEWGSSSGVSKTRRLRTIAAEAPYATFFPPPT
jgi:hypothetical protein